MAFRVGIQCVATSEMAHDIVLSALPPVLLADGTMVRPKKIENTWYYQDSPVNFDFPECSYASQIKDGFMVGSSFVSVLFVVIAFRVFYQMIYAIGGNSDN